MDERMTLEMVRALLRGAADGRLPLPKPQDCMRLADAITAHLTQPAQAVDLGALSWLPAELRILAFGDELEDMTTGEAYHAGWNECLDAIRRHRTRAIGNAQAEGCVRWSTDAIYEARGRFELTGDEMWLPTPPTKATPNAHE